jgi:hypothetical protein
MSGSIGLNVSQSTTTNELYAQTRTQKGGGRNGLSSVCEVFGGTLTLALFIIGCVAAAGHMTGVVAGSCAVGLSAPLLLASVLRAVMADNPVERSTAVGSMIMHIALIIIGSLAIAGVIPASAVGLAIILPTVIGLAISCCACCCACSAILALLGLGAAATAFSD